MRSSASRVELLAPAGTPEKLEIAVHYGADAVYLAGQNFSLRNFSANFSEPELYAARTFTQDHGVRMYVAVNIYSRDRETHAIRCYLDVLGKVNPDALIVADPAVFMLARKHLPHISLHISTQANTTNTGTARFWKNLGASRVNTARELNLTEIREMAKHSGIEIEAFAHGAMCMAYSGRCLMSGYMAGRESNRGECCQPCRFHYTVMEETRPGQYFPVFEDDRGSYIFNSRDLCMIHHIPEMVDAGIASLKIEGRMKSIHYLASVVKVYREAIDAWYESPETYTVRPEWDEELTAVSHRGYGTGFYFENACETMMNTVNRVHPGYRFVAQVLSPTPDGGNRILVKNRMLENETVNVLSPGGPTRLDRIKQIVDENGVRQSVAQPGSRVVLYLDTPAKRLDLIRCPPSDL
ncbi:U32 family peptidase [Desulfosarcina sp. OttesenSCG-928-A07]|nr:U32 family peptidase [Desulfosarcina sp. OttesenSCG-928-A07]